MKYSLVKLLKAQKMAIDGLIAAPESFKKASWLELVEYCNGCGAADSWFRPPPTIYGTWIGAACIIHDWRYTFGLSEEDKNRADKEMHSNIIKLIIADSKWFKPVTLQKARAWTYYQAVKLFGNKAFWKNKVRSSVGA